MMEENNRKGPGVFYAVMGVATLVVAIIGATFAYFSASATTGNDVDVSGGTNNDLAEALSIKVEEVHPDGTVAGVSHNLVPANIDEGIEDAQLEKVNNAVANKCVASGYTGCHLWKITAKATQNISTAGVWLETLTTTATTKTDWHYTIFKGTETSATSLVLSGDINLASRVDMHKAASLTANQEVVYYLLVYLTNTDKSQNSTDNGGSNQTGSYSGTVSMDAAGGQVSATFTATGV